jgi:hypothetical protein
MLLTWFRLSAKSLEGVDPQVFEVRDIQYSVGLPAVGISDAVGDDRIPKVLRNDS